MAVLKGHSSLNSSESRQVLECHLTLTQGTLRKCKEQKSRKMGREAVRCCLLHTTWRSCSGAHVAQLSAQDQASQNFSMCGDESMRPHSQWQFLGTDEGWRIFFLGGMTTPQWWPRPCTYEQLSLAFVVVLLCFEFFLEDLGHAGETWWESEEGNCIFYTNSSLSTCMTSLIKHTKKNSLKFSNVNPRTQDL